MSLSIHLIQKVRRMTFYLRRFIKLKYLLIIVVAFLYFSGAFTFLFEKSFERDFLIDNYLKGDIDKIKKGDLIHRPFDNYNYQFKYDAGTKCQDSDIRVVYIVKSALGHLSRRKAIRSSWGFERRFSDVEIRTVFVLGISDDHTLQQEIDKENNVHNDIVQAKFYDSYYNNTIKTMMAIKWVVSHCSSAKFYFFSDDDMYVSTKNVLRFIRNPLDYPNYLEVPMISIKQKLEAGQKDASYPKLKNSGTVLDFELPDDAELYAGYVFDKVRPHRHHWSKWYVSYKEYPFNQWPPYVTAGAYILSNVVLHNFYYASQFIPHFRFDDIYIAMLAWNLGLSPVHNKEFHFYKKPYTTLGYQYVIASHGYHNPYELEYVWNEQKSAGNA